MLVSSPRPWGCFLIRDYAVDFLSVFPTPVGVFPAPATNFTGWQSLPHARGGVSTVAYRQTLGSESSPRPWGCFSNATIRSYIRSVFPTPVGVFLIHQPNSVSTPSLPHARGGVSIKEANSFTFFKSSPRPWGCF